MCRAVHVRLSSSERKEVARWSGVMIPVYASIAVIILVALIATQGLPPGWLPGEMWIAKRRGWQ